MSFTGAIEQLGGAVISSYAESSSVQKGESLIDTVRNLEQYSDVIVSRYPLSGSVAQVSQWIVLNQLLCREWRW